MMHWTVFAMYGLSLLVVDGLFILVAFPEQSMGSRAHGFQ